MSDMVYAPCEHGKVLSHFMQRPPMGEGEVACGGGRPLGTVDEIEAALAYLQWLRGSGEEGFVAKAAAYDEGVTIEVTADLGCLPDEAVEWMYALGLEPWVGDKVRIVQEVEE